MTFSRAFHTAGMVVTIGVFGGLLLTLILVEHPGKPAPYYISHNNGWEWVHSYKEQDGCVEWSDGKACGNYTIHDYRHEYKGD